MKRVTIRPDELASGIPEKQTEQQILAVYLYDETELYNYKQAITDQKMVAGLIYLDNYDEALESVEEVRRSLLTALIDRKINKYISAVNGIVKKLEKDKYFFAASGKRAVWTSGRSKNSQYRKRDGGDTKYRYRNEWRYLHPEL